MNDDVSALSADVSLFVYEVFGTVSSKIKVSPYIQHAVKTHTFTK